MKRKPKRRNKKITNTKKKTSKSLDISKEITKALIGTAKKFLKTKIPWLSLR